MAVLISRPQLALQPGTLGPFSAIIANAPANWLVIFTKGAWPISGEVLKVTIEESPDAVTPFVFSAALSLSGGNWFDRAHNLTNAGTWSTTPMFRGPNARIRATVEVLQACTIGFDVSA